MMAEACLQGIAQALTKLHLSKAEEAVAQALAEGIDTERILDKGVAPAFHTISCDIQDGKVFDAEVLVFARGVARVVRQTRLGTADGAKPTKGPRVLLGAEKLTMTNLHVYQGHVDRIVGLLTEAYGVSVLNLGVDLALDDFVDGARAHTPSMIIALTRAQGRLAELRNAVPDVPHVLTIPPHEGNPLILPSIDLVRILSEGFAMYRGRRAETVNSLAAHAVAPKPTAARATVVQDEYVRVRLPGNWRREDEGRRRFRSADGRERFTVGVPRWPADESTPTSFEEHGVLFQRFVEERLTKARKKGVVFGEPRFARSSSLFSFLRVTYDGTLASRSQRLFWLFLLLFPPGEHALVYTVSYNAVGFSADEFSSRREQILDSLFLHSRKIMTSDEKARERAP